ncbi:MAG: ATP-binding protein [Sporomusaceae bacterium]|nr:ATP-binding protein [Sporomusaceae bacterium]
MKNGDLILRLEGNILSILLLLFLLLIAEPNLPLEEDTDHQLHRLITLLNVFLVIACISLTHHFFTNFKAKLNYTAKTLITSSSEVCPTSWPDLAPLFEYLTQQKESMRKLDRLNMVGEMSAGIAHEIRNPMTTVRGLLQFLSHKKELAAHHDNFSLMIDEIDRANSIITEFLSLAKNRPLEFKEKNLNDIVCEIYPLLETDALRNNCQIKLDLTPTPNLLIDPNSIRQLILNLVRNGLEAMIENHGQLVIATKSTAQGVLLAIKDNGPGISPTIQAKLGTPFLTTKETGTGLGLTICYRILERHRATLTVDSAPSSGTIFTICFANSFPEKLQKLS